MRRRWVSYRKSFLRALKDPEEAAAYLNAAIEDGDREGFLIALRHVIAARGPMAEMARRAHVHRVSLHKMLAPGGNPTVESLIALFRVLGIRIQLPAVSRSARSERKVA